MSVGVIFFLPQHFLQFRHPQLRHSFFFLFSNSVQFTFTFIFSFHFFLFFLSFLPAIFLICSLLLCAPQQGFRRVHPPRAVRTSPPPNHRPRWEPQATVCDIRSRQICLIGAHYTTSTWKTLAPTAESARDKCWVSSFQNTYTDTFSHRGSYMCLYLHVYTIEKYPFYT